MSSFSVVSSTRPSCWTILPQGNNVSIVAAIEDRVYQVVPFEVVTLVCLRTSMNVHVTLCTL